MAEHGSINRTAERPGGGSNGGLILLAILALLAVGIWLVTKIESPDGAAQGIFGIFLIVVASFGLAGFYSLQPNEGAAITLFGSYKGTDRITGLRWVLPWYGRKKISLRVRNVTSEMLKVNDKRGNPIEIAANVVWRVEDSAQALFDVDDYVAFSAAPENAEFHGCVSTDEDRIRHSVIHDQNREKVDDLSILDAL